MTEAEVFILADQALNNVVSQIKDDQWDMAIPDWFQLGRSTGDETLRTIINYHAFDEAWVPHTLAGEGHDDGIAAGAPADMNADLLGKDPKEAFAVFTDKGIAAAKAVADFDKVVHLSYGDWPTRDYLMHITSFRGFRAFDLSKLIGIDTKLPDDLVQGMWDEFSPHLAEWRKMGIFKESLPIPDDASLQDKLMLSVGRGVS